MNSTHGLHQTQLDSKKNSKAQLAANRWEALTSWDKKYYETVGGNGRYVPQKLWQLDVQQGES